MSLERFKIISPKEALDQVDNKIVQEVILLNTLHIVSVKPVTFQFDNKDQLGYWIRLANGKKYRAIEIPSDLKNKIESL